MHWGYGWGTGMGFGWIFMVLFWALVIAGVVYFVKLIAGGGGREDKRTDPMGILEKRYAKGEITKEEFETIKDDLTKH